MVFKKLKARFKLRKLPKEARRVIVDLQNEFDEMYRTSVLDTHREMLNFQFDKKGKDNRKEIKPMDIVHTLEADIDFPLENAKEFAKELEARIKFTKKHIAGSSNRDNVRALDMLKARIKYPKYAQKFNWKTTTEEHIEKLIKKYKLAHKGIRDYMRTIPTMAVNCMRKYTEVHDKVSKEKPEFTLIAPTNHFKDPKNYSDPILLVKSPFGSFYYILTAWDEEVSMVSELLDGEELVIEENGNGKIKSKKDALQKDSDEKENEQ